VKFVVHIFGNKTYTLQVRIFTSK